MKWFNFCFFLLLAVIPLWSWAATSNGDKIDQKPISIPNTWTQTPTCTPTVISAVTVTYTPTITQTATPHYNCIFAALGDSYIYGEGASAPASIFAKLTYDGLNKWYPGIEYEVDGKPATRGEDWLYLLPIELAKYKEKGIPLGYVLFQIGSCCFFYAHDSGGYADCCKGSSLSEGVSASYLYKKNMDKLIGEIYAAYPDVHLVVPNVPDPGCGDKTYALPAIFEAYRQRLYELQSKYPKMRIVDLYSAMAGHLEYFKPNGSSKLSKDLIEVMEYYKRNHPNDLGQTIVAKCILDKFKNWEYVPKPSK
jgi:hypothetical protein